MNLRAIWIGRIIWMSGVLIVLSGRWLAHGYLNDYFFIIGFSLVVIGIIVLAFTQRCPRCGQFFNASPFWWGRLGYCRKCGNRLEYDQSV